MMNSARKGLVVMATLGLVACSKDESASLPDTSTLASAAPSASTAPVVSAAPSASATPPEPPHDCPAGSTGIGSYAKPCEAKGTSRMMEVKLTKLGDPGPSFSVTNKSAITILYGAIAVYFYDKTGKQLDVPDDNGKARPYHTCSGKFFGGVMKPGEKAVLTFSCVGKSKVPDGTVSVEAEMTMVGFADATEKKIDFYWRNSDLAPDVRPKGAK